MLPVAAAVGRRGPLVALVAAVAIVAEAITLTFTRAGLITMTTSVVIVLVARVRRDGFDRGAKALAGIAVMVAVQFLASRPVEALRLRLTSEGQDAWYSALFSGPAELHIPTGGRAAVPVTITNTGRVAWSSDVARPILRICGVLLPAVLSALVLTQALFGAGNTKFVMFVEFGLHFGCLVPLAWFFGIFLGWGVFGVWMGAFAYIVLLCSIMGWKFAEGRWKEIQI